MVVIQLIPCLRSGVMFGKMLNINFDQTLEFLFTVKNKDINTEIR